MSIPIPLFTSLLSAFQVSQEFIRTGLLSHLLDFPHFGVSSAMTWGLLASFADHGSLPQDPYKHNLHKQFCSPGLKFSCSPHSSKDLEFTTLQLLHLTVLPDFTSQTVLPFSKRSSGAPPPVSFAHPSETSSTACTQPYCPSSRYCCGQRPP